MSEKTHHHHHHHHHIDGATRFKRKNLASLKRRKLIEKYAFWGLCAIAVLMAIAVVVVYKLT